MARKSFFWWLILLLLVAAWLGIQGLNADTLWYDEWYSLYYAGASPQHGPVPLNVIWERVAQDSDPQPPGYYIALGLWGQFVGWTPFATRALSLLFGILAIAGVYRLGSDLVSPLAGFGAALAFGSSSFLIFHMHELRTYTLYPLLVVFSLWGYWRIVSGTRRPSIWLTGAFLFSVTALLYTHYLALPLLLVAGTYHLFFVGKRTRRWWLAAFLALMAVMLFLPWLNIALGAFTKVSADPSRQFFALEPVALIGAMLDAFSNGSIALFVIFVWYALRSYNKRGPRFIWLMAVGTLALTIAVNQSVGFITDPRYLMAMWPLLALVAGLGVAFMAQRNLRPWIVLGIWLAAGIWLSFNSFTLAPGEWQVRQAWDKLAQTVKQYGQPGDTIIYYPPEPVPYWIHAPVAAFYLSDVPANVQPMPPGIFPPAVTSQTPVQLHLIQSLEGKTPDAFRNDTAAIVGDLSRLWMAYSPQDLPSPFARTAFEQVTADRFVACDPVLADPDLKLTLYTRFDSVERPLRFGEGIELGLLAPLSPEADQNLPILLGWSVADDTVHNTHSVALHIENEQGVLVGQADYGVPHAGQVCQTASIATADLLPGQYRLWVIVYNWQTGERMLGQAPGDALEADRLQLGEITVSH